MAKDFYEILGVGKNATRDEIKRAYRKLAHEHHPDKSGAGNDARFREINQAYEVLSDDSKRAQYDQFGQTFEQARSAGNPGFGGFSGFEDFSDFMRGFGDNFSRGPFAGVNFDFGDVFSDMFGNPRKKRREQGVDLEMNLEIEFLESVFGTEKEITLERKDACPRCQGSGAESGSKVVTCAKCHGQGQIVTHQRTILGTMQRMDVCETCSGTGKVPEKKCQECSGVGVKKRTKKIKIIVPPGIDIGQRLRLAGEGEIGYRGSKPGDLYVVIKIKPHPDLERKGFDIYSHVPISFHQAALGGRVEIKTVDGPMMLKIPAGTQSGKVFRIGSRGVPYLESKRRGDHYVEVRVVTPEKLTKTQKEILRQFAQERGEAMDSDESVWRKIKDSL